MQRAERARAGEVPEDRDWSRSGTDRDWSRGGTGLRTGGADRGWPSGATGWYRRNNLLRRQTIHRQRQSRYPIAVQSVRRPTPAKVWFDVEPQDRNGLQPRSDAGGPAARRRGRPGDAGGVAARRRGQRGGRAAGAAWGGPGVPATRAAWAARAARQPGRRGRPGQPGRPGSQPPPRSSRTYSPDSPDSAEPPDPAGRSRPATTYCTSSSLVTTSQRRSPRTTGGSHR
jgi:hypothetical protein